MLMNAYETVREAIESKDDGEWVVEIKGAEGFLVVSTEESDRLEIAGQIKAFWMKRSTGNIVSVPVGDEF